MRLKRLVCLILALSVCCGLAAAEETEKTPDFVMAGFDDTQYRDWVNNQFFMRMEEWTGVTFGYRQYRKLSEWTQAKAEMTAGGDMPDVLFKAALTAGEAIEMREKGVLIDLLPYLEEHAPHLWAILQENPDYLQAITLPDGSVAALPYITTLPVQNYMWINTAWLNTLHLDEPTNAEELVKVLTAFLEKDPNRNGRSDEIPLGFLGPFDLKFLAHAFGLTANDYNVFAQDGQAKFMPLEENYRLFVTWCRDLFQAKLLDQNGFVTNNSLRTVTDANAKATYGMIITPVAADIFRVEWGQQDYNILLPLTYEGEQIYRSFAGPLLRGAFAVTSHCAEPEKLVEWVDRLYTEEGAILASIGKENVDYVIDGDGTWRMTESARSASSYYSAYTLIDGGGTYPGILADEFQRRYGDSQILSAVLARQDQMKDVAKLPFPYYSLTGSEQEKIDALQQQIGYYVDMQLARWVLGEEEISDAAFEAFETHLNELGLQDFMAFWQEVLDRQ